jgi:hypothetical protein
MSTSLDITNLFSISQGWGEDALAELPLAPWHRFPDKKSSLRPCYCSRHWKAPVPHVRQNTYSTSSTVKVDAVTETNLNTMPTCVSLRRNDVHCWWLASKYNSTRACIQQNLVAIRYRICALPCRGNGPYANPLPSQDRSLMFSIVSV